MATLLTGYANPEIAHGLDGLVYHNNSLVGVYNYSIMRNSFDTSVVIRYRLNTEGDTITGEEIIDKNNPLFRQPTTALISGNKLFVLANSNLQIYNKNKQSTKGKEEELNPVIVTKYEITD
jgi:hypothetical protein